MGLSKGSNSACRLMHRQLSTLFHKARISPEPGYRRACDDQVACEKAVFSGVARDSFALWKVPELSTLSTVQIERPSPAAHQVDQRFVRISALENRYQRTRARAIIKSLSCENGAAARSWP